MMAEAPNKLEENGGQPQPKRRGAERLHAPPIAPVYWQDAPGQTIDLGMEQVRFTVHGQTYEDFGQAQLRLVPDDRLMISVPAEGKHPLIGLILMEEDQWDGKLHLVGRNIAVDMLYVGNDGQNRLGFIPKRSVVGMHAPAAGIAYAVAHLFNFPEFFGPDDYVLVTGQPPRHGSQCCGRAFLRADGWKVTIAATDKTDAIDKVLSHAGGYAVTHVVRIEREDASTFSSDDLRDLLQCLHYYLTFVLGRWAGLALPVGFDSDGNRVFEQWGTPMVASGRWRGSCSWFDQMHGGLLSEVFSGFAARWQSPLWGDVLREALYWYAGACERGTGIGVDTGLILAQTALELLAWTHSTQDQGLISEDSFRKLPASDKLRLLFRSLGIPSSLPSGLSALNNVPGRKLTDSPEAITEVRNAIIHPHAKKQFQDGSYYEAWKLALWYVDLVMLRLCGHNGQYANRLVSRHSGEVEQVPWV